jgi:hypothetical protein
VGFPGGNLTSISLSRKIASPVGIALQPLPTSLPHTQLLDYVLYRAFSKETEFSDQSAANVHYAAFMAALTGKAKTELGLNPSSAAPANTTTVS